MQSQSVRKLNVDAWQFVEAAVAVLLLLLLVAVVVAVDAVGAVFVASYGE